MGAPRLRFAGLVCGAYVLFVKALKTRIAMKVESCDVKKGSSTRSASEKTQYLEGSVFLAHGRNPRSNIWEYREL